MIVIIMLDTQESLQVHNNAEPYANRAIKNLVQSFDWEQINPALYSWSDIVTFAYPWVDSTFRTMKKNNSKQEMQFT